MDSLDPLKKVIAKNREKAAKEAEVEDGFHWLYYRVTFILFLACSIVNGCQEVLMKDTKAFQCMMTGENANDEALVNAVTSYCHLTGGYTLGDTGRIGHTLYRQEEHRTYHAYYLWVPIVLVFQAASFYAPRMLAKTWENKNLKVVLGSLKESVTMCDADRDAKLTKVADFLSKHLLMSRSNKWALKMTLVTLVYLGVSILNVYVTNLFLNRSFVLYGYDVSQFYYQHWNDHAAFMGFDPLNIRQDGLVGPMERAFPIMTKCDFQNYGSSGTVQRRDAICVLPVNVINQKIYVLLWFWIHGLVFVTALAIVATLLEYACPTISRVKIWLRCSCDSDGQDVLNRLSRHLRFGDWKVMTKIASVHAATDEHAVREVLSLVCKKIEDKKASRRNQYDQ